MTERNLDPSQMFSTWEDTHTPEMSFERTAPSDFEAWKGATLPRVLATLGDWPNRVPPNPELLLEWETDGLVKQRWVLDVGQYISATLLVNIPGDLDSGERRPAILCWHGHGPYGKESVMGNDSTPERRANIALHNYDYGLQMAREGFVTFALDWIGMGERGQRDTPYSHSLCNPFYLRATMLGTTPLAINVTHGLAATDLASSLPFVDSERLGVMGLSGGGVMALWSGLCDTRFKAFEIMGYSYLFARLRGGCGMQISPGLFKLVDLPDLQGLLAPKPLLVDIGVRDTTFPADEAMTCFRGVERIYVAAGASDLLELDFYEGEHAWGANKSVAFFSRHLGLCQPGAAVSA